MKEIELCMQYYDCKRCPKYNQCIAEEKKQEKEKRKDRDERRKFKRGYYE